MEFKIEKGIKIPQMQIRGYTFSNGMRSKQLNYPFSDMEVGDSFIISNEYSRDTMQRKACAPRNWAYKRKNGWKFALRKTKDNKIRVWRVK